MPSKAYAVNRRARYDYDIQDTLEAGLVLLGTEVKSVRAGRCNLKGAFITMHNQEPYLTNATIPPWQPANTPDSYDPARPRKLLLTTAERKTLLGKHKSQRLTIVPLKVYGGKSGKIKVQIGIARGKKRFAKKQAKKEADIKLDTQRYLRGKL